MALPVVCHKKETTTGAGDMANDVADVATAGNCRLSEGGSSLSSAPWPIAVVLQQNVFEQFECHLFI